MGTFLPIPRISSSSYLSIALGSQLLFSMALSDLQLEAGFKFEEKVWKKFGVPVNFLEVRNLKEFFLVAKFTRSKIRLNEDSVGPILQSCFGSHASRFKVQCCQNWTFKFSVASKDVGLFNFHGGNISNQNFNLSFWPRGGGGPDYLREFELLCHEEDDEWTQARQCPQSSYMREMPVYRPCESVLH
ncbi:hypothetical protein D1007_22367 [Hordeum vulgare]|nr:hypothetical protein D1007_22367 [Hordeum vulgare]